MEIQDTARIKELESEIIRLMKRFDTLDLQELSIKGAMHHAKLHLKGCPVEKRTEIINAVAAGIFMGFRKKEAMLGISGGDWYIKNMGEINGK